MWGLNYRRDAADGQAGLRRGANITSLTRGAGGGVGGTFERAPRSSARRGAMAGVRRTCRSVSRAAFELGFSAGSARRRTGGGRPSQGDPADGVLPPRRHRRHAEPLLARGAGQRNRAAVRAPVPRRARVVAPGRLRERVRGELRRRADLPGRRRRRAATAPGSICPRSNSCAICRADAREGVRAESRRRAARRSAGDLSPPAREAVPVVRRSASRVYDRYLRANRVEAGIASYGLVVDLLLGTDGTPPCGAHWPAPIGAPGAVRAASVVDGERRCGDMMAPRLRGGRCSSW